MSDNWYTVTGRETGKEYLILVRERYTDVFPPHAFTLPWTGESGIEYGLSYSIGSEHTFRGGPRWSGWKARRWVRQVERLHTRDRRRTRRVGDEVRRRRG